MSDKPAAEAKPEEQAPAKSRGDLMQLLIICGAMALILGGIGFFLAFYVLPARLAGQLQQAQTAQAAQTPTPAETGTNAAPTSAPAKEANSSAPVTTEHKQRTAEELAAEGGKVVTKFTIEEVTVNVADTRGSRFVRAGVYFEAPPEVLEELEANRARIIDSFSQELSSKTLDQLTSPSIRGVLREELLGTLNPTLHQGRIDNVYFTDLLIQ